MNSEELKIEIEKELERIRDFGDGPLEFETSFVEPLIREFQKAEKARAKIEDLISEYFILIEKHKSLKCFYSAAAAKQVLDDLKTIKEALK